MRYGPFFLRAFGAWGLSTLEVAGLVLWGVQKADYQEGKRRIGDEFLRGELAIGGSS